LEMMKAVGLHRSLPVDHPESLIDVEIEKPMQSGRNLLVKVHAISVNPIDTKMRMRKNQQSHTPTILGWDVAGVVEKVGPDCKLFQPGDEVFYAGSLTEPGCNSEYHLI